MQSPTPILIVGTSARYLAQSGQTHGYPVFAADAYADSDTRLACRSVCRADDAAPRSLSEACGRLDADDLMPWMYGSGFETAPDWLAKRARRNPKLIGNSATVMQLLAGPQRFFALLDELAIPFPAISYQRPLDTAGWLFKDARRSGGVGVYLARAARTASANGYYQRFINGPLCSLLFSADGHSVRVLGTNRLMASYPAAGDFRFAGVINGLGVTPTQATQMADAAQRLTRALGLRGINGLDFVIRNGEPLLLELNARPPASLELYESDLPRGGLACHVDACLGCLYEPRTSGRVRGLRVLYAQADLTIGDMPWPGWVKDRPSSGERIGVAEPLCTVHAAGLQVESVAAELRHRMDAIRCLINGHAKEAA